MPIKKMLSDPSDFAKTEEEYDVLVNKAFPVEMYLIK
jgi:hypothetical protein